MTTYHLNSKAINYSVVLILLSALLLTACAAPATAEPYGPVEELTFQLGP
jgi:PBP1b-binding outer membrane lipoprotein LpoB